MVAVETTEDLAAAVGERFGDCHVLLMAAAPADFRAADPAATKLSRSGAPPELRLEPTEDVLAGVARGRREGQTLIGFAAETGAGAIERAREKLERKAVDAIVFNDVSRSEIGFDSELNEVTVLERGNEHARAAGAQRTRWRRRSWTGSRRSAAGSKARHRAVVNSS